MSAVSNNVMPDSIAWSTTLRVASRSIFMPKLLHPSPTSETCNPEFPSLRSSTQRLLWANCPTLLQYDKRAQSVTQEHFHVTNDGKPRPRRPHREFLHLV